jgi:hypothetical protein
MTKAKKVWAPRATDRLWGAIRIWALIFIVAATVTCGLLVHKAVVLGGLDAADYMTENDFVPGLEAETLVLGGIILVYLLTYVIGAFLVLCWYLRSIRNARTLHRGIETSPAWVVWYFIIPVLSLFRPYSMTSELWRSSDTPENWKGARDPALLRWWWGAVIAASLDGVVANGFSQAAETVAVLQVGTVLLAICYGLQAVAGLLFLRVGGPISRRQTALIVSGHRPPEPTIPAWSA